MVSLRTPETSKKYHEDVLSKKWDSKTFVFNWQNNHIRLFNYWALIVPDYPYDLIAEVHHLLVPKRIFPSYKEVNNEEYEELKEIKDILKSDYDFILENLPSKITITSHYHLHFIKMKKDL